MNLEAFAARGMAAQKAANQVVRGVSHSSNNFRKGPKGQSVTGNASDQRERDARAEQPRRRSGQRRVVGQTHLRGEVRTDRDGLTRCRVCGCTEVDACAGGCSWVEEDLCSTCSVAAEALVIWTVEARRANRAALEREVERQLGEVTVNVVPARRSAA